MPVSIKSVHNLQAGSNKKWKNLPTKAIRVPGVFAEKLLQIARELDRGKSISDRDIYTALEALSIQELLDLKKHIPEIIKKKREGLYDRSLEQAVVFIASRCDGASSNDSQGFNGCDTRFGKWVAERIEDKQLLSNKIAYSALKMLQKYLNTQLNPAGYNLPKWGDICHQYPDKIYTESESDETSDRQLPSRRLILEGEEIALYSPFDRKELEKIKDKKYFENFPTPNYVGGKFHSWRFSLLEAQRLVLRFTDFWVDPQIEAVIMLQQQEQETEKQRKLAEASSKADELVELVKLAKLHRPLSCGWNLFEHQKKAAEWLLAHRRGGIYRGGILADSMGLGKTLSALVASKALKLKYSDVSIFVICPASLRENWAREAEKVGIEIETFSWAKMPKPLESKPYVLIADESHYCQNLKARRTQHIIELAEQKNCLATWLLSGTPIKNGRPVNLFPLLVAIDHPLAKNKWEYEKHYCNAGYKSIGKDKCIWDTTGAAHLDELAKKTEDCILRRTKSECLDLPEKMRVLKPVGLESKQEKAYKAEIQGFIQSYRDRVDRGEVDPDAEALVTLNILRKVGSKYKVDYAEQQVLEFLEQGQQVVVFTEYLEAAKLLYRRLKTYCKPEILIGETKVEERQAIVDRFQSGESKVFVGTIKAGGVGLTLTASNNVILVDRPWTPGDAEQAEDRCHRIGAKNTVTAFWLQLGHIDKSIDELLESKQQRIELVLKGKRKTLRGLDSPKELAKQLLQIL